MEKIVKSLFLVFYLLNQWLIRHKVIQLYTSGKKIQNFRLVYCSYLHKMYFK